MSNQEMQFADPDWRPSQQLDPINDQQEREAPAPQPINNEYLEHNKWNSAPFATPQQQEGYTGLRPYNAPIPGQMQRGMYGQRSYRRRGRGLWFWIVLAFIVFSLISGGSHFRGFNPGYDPGFNQGPVSQGQVIGIGQPISYDVKGQATVVINDPNANITVTQGQSNNQVIFQAVNINSFPGNDNNIQQFIRQNNDTLTADIQNSQDLQVTVPKGVNLTVNSGAGNITLKGVQGQLTLSTTDGQISASNDALSGPSSLSTDTGDINFYGSISAGGNYQFTSNSGNVTVTLPTSPAFQVDATTNSGSISLPGIQNTNSGTQAKGVIGTNSQAQGTNVSLKTDSGNINLNQN